jgi:uncharacterized protein with beta-barrel porin domain
VNLELIPEQGEDLAPGADRLSRAVALLLTGTGATPAAAACYTGLFPYSNTNSKVSSCIQVANTSFSGNVVNNGVITPGGIGVTNSTVTGYIINNNVIDSGGISVANSTIIGGIADNGTTLLGGITVDRRSVITGSGSITAIAVSLSTFAGGISNAGVITSNGSGISVGAVLTFGGGITNSGSITAGFNDIVIFGATAFSGGIVNSGKISSPSSFGILVALVSTFSGGVTNTGTITAGAGVRVGYAGYPVAAFSGGVSNSGVITAVKSGIGVVNVSAFSGGITNSGSITGATGVLFGPGNSTFSGAIVNSGSITGSGGVAINVAAANNPITINQTGGVITGAIDLSANADVLNISGGAINGNIVGQGSSDTVNFALGAGAFTYGSSYEFSGINQVNVDSGTVILDGANSATNLAVNGGTLEIGDAANPSATFAVANPVNVYGQLAGVGTLDPPSVTIHSGGVLAPGPLGGIGALTIVGDLVFQPGATYQVQINPTTASLAKVMGPASLSGNVLAVFAPGAYLARQYTILTTTGGLGGTMFAGLTTADPPAGFAERLAYDADNVYLDLTATLASLPGLNVNQQNVANALDKAFNSGAGLPPAFANVAGLAGPSLGAALTQLSGEPATAARQSDFLFSDLFLSLLLDPYIENRGGGPGQAGSFAAALGYAEDGQTPQSVASAYSALAKDPTASAPTAPPPPRWNLWGAGFGGGEQTSGNVTVGSHNSSIGAGGFAAGADYHVSPDAMLGFAVAGGGTSWSLSDGLGGGNGALFEAGLYGAAEFGPAYVAAAVSAGVASETTNRTVALPGGGAYNASFNAPQFGGRIEAGYHVPLAPATLTPYVALQGLAFEAPSYAESAAAGGPGFALKYASQSASDTRFELGAWADKTFVMPDGEPMKLFGRLAWAHDWQSNSALTATFQSLPIASFVVNGARPAPDQALITVGAEWSLAKNWTLMAKFEGEFGAGSQTYAATGRISCVW